MTGPSGPPDTSVAVVPASCVPPTCLHLIHDLGFPREGTHNATAGLKFAAHVKELSPELPVLVQTSQPESYSLSSQSSGLR